MIIDSPIISGSQLSSGPLNQVGNVQITGSLSVTGAINGSITGSITSASYATNAEFLDRLDSTSFVFTSSFEEYSGSVSTRETNLEATASVLTTASASFAVVSSSFATTSGSLSTRTTNLEATASTNTQASASFAVVSASFASTSGSLSTRVTNLEATSSTVSSSFAATSGSIAGRVTLIEGQYATTGSNTFTAPQHITDTSNAISFTSTASLYTEGGLRVKGSSFISGTAYFNDVVVYGTSSIQYITSSQLAIGTNIITLNTDTPSVRFGGISVFDSGSNNLSTGSLFWDSEKDKWIYANPSGSTYDGGMLISGPRNTSGLGNEVGTTSCALMMGQGGDHITSSAIFSYGNATCFYGTSYIASTGQVCGVMSNFACIGVCTQTPKSYLHLAGDNAFNTPLGDILMTRYYTNDSLVAGSSLFHFYNNTDSKDYLAAGVAGSGGTGGKPNQLSQIKMVVGASGNVGIGTTAPSVLLDVSKCAATNININSTNLYLNQGNLIQFCQNTTGGAVVGYIGHAGDSTGDLTIFNGGAKRVAISSTGIACFACQVCASQILASAYICAGTYAFGSGGYRLGYYGASTDSRSWILGNDVLAFGDFAIMQSTTQTGSTYNVLMYVRCTGNIGIGTTTPSQKLEIAASSSDVILKVKNTCSTGTAKLLLNPEGAGAGSTGDGSIFFDMNSTAWLAGVDKSDSSKFKIANDVYGDFSTNNYFNITTGGNVGIGTSAPSQKLHVIGGNLQTAGNSSWYRNVFERNISTWDTFVSFAPQSSPQYTYGYINITASGYVNGTSAGGSTISRWYYSITNNSISVSVVGSDITNGSQAPSIRLIVTSNVINVQAQSASPGATSYTTMFVDAMLASGYVNGTYWLIS